MRFAEEKRLRSENVDIDSIFEDEDDDSVITMDILKDEVTLRVKNLFKANVTKNLGGSSLIGIACFSYDKIIKFMKIHISMYSTGLEDREHSSNVIESIYDDIVKDKCVKKDLSLFLKEVKMKNEVYIINKNRLIAKNNNLF